MLGDADREPVLFLPRGAFSQLTRDPSGSQPWSGASLEGQGDAAPDAGDDVPAGQQDRQDRVVAGEVAVEEDEPAREQAALLGREGLQQGLLAVAGRAEDRPADHAAGAGGQRDDPHLRERGGAVSGPGRAEVVPVLLRVGDVDQHAVDRVDGHPGYRDR